MSSVLGCQSDRTAEMSPPAGLDRGRLTLLIPEFQTLRSLVRVGSLSEADMFPHSVQTARRLVELGLAAQNNARYSATEVGTRVAAATPFGWTDEIVVLDDPRVGS